MKFFIYEGNKEACEKEMVRIKRKCANAGIPFMYRLTGREMFEEYGEKPNTINVRFIEVEAEGKIKWNGWNVIARIEHKDAGNLVYSMTNTPDTKWWTMDSFCDHCGTNRARNVTYILEDKDGNRKQVDSTCLKEFTNGLDAEALAKYFEIYNMDERDAYIPTTKTILYLKTKDVLSAYIRETEENGFVKSDGEKPTRLSGRRYFGTDNKNMDKVEAVIKFYESKDDTSDFIMNVKSVLRNEYCDFSMFGILACLWHCYTRELKRIEREQQKKEIREQTSLHPHFKEMKEISKISKHLYKKDQKIQIEVTGKIVTSFENFYGETVRVYCFTDREGNIYTWKTSCWIGEEIRNGGWFIIRGTVKENSVYMGEKQTVLVRVKVVK